MIISKSSPQDIDEIFRLYQAATDYQKTKYTVYWPAFSRTLVETEIEENRQWKMVIDNAVACVWAIAFTDPQIWEERNNQPSLYLHRIATNPDFRGRHLIQPIVAWAKNYALLNGKQYVRLDTVGRNEKLIEHYTSYGFNYLGLFNLKDTNGLPAHYEQDGVSLFELAADS
jgi:GNAT superfamily N-acetyltransferase